MRAVCGYTRQENFSTAQIVVSCLGALGGERCEVITNCTAARPDPYFTANDPEAVLAE